ncbi:unannotated protein [freshwater metagenome]|uniref:Unannotated protein n=1 Tax=freshwater metagenome TaxID=449393 RepID=A0A6J6J4U1_9ZZZZ|nr:hypothetical protein [Actinomycetota bacterium]
MSDAQSRKSRFGYRAPAAQKQVQLKLVKIEVWSAIKAGFFITFAAGIATLVGFFAIWLIVGQIGLFASLNSLLAGVFGDGGVDIEQELSLPRVMSFAGTLAIVNIILGTALAGIYAMIFNVIGRITGGIAVSFTNN